MKSLSLLFLFLSLCFHSYGQNPVNKDETAPTFLMYSIYFGGGSYGIDSDQEQGLYDFLNSIPNIENYAISVHSYTDDIGGKRYNQWLSGMRSDEVIGLLLGQSIERQRISIQDFGELNPIYDNATWEGKLKNRRSDVILIPLLF